MEGTAVDNDLNATHRGGDIAAALADIRSSFRSGQPPITGPAAGAGAGGGGGEGASASHGMQKRAAIVRRTSSGSMRGTARHGSSSAINSLIGSQRHLLDLMEDDGSPLAESRSPRSSTSGRGFRRSYVLRVDRAAQDTTTHPCRCLSSSGSQLSGDTRPDSPIAGDLMVTHDVDTGHVVTMTKPRRAPQASPPPAAGPSRDRAATQIQKTVRGRQGRKRAQRVRKSSRAAPSRDKAAIQIQRTARGRLGRKRAASKRAQGKKTTKKRAKRRSRASKPEDHAATQIQRTVRGRQGRKRAQKVRQAANTSAAGAGGGVGAGAGARASAGMSPDFAATRIQSSFRGLRGRKKAKRVRQARRKGKGSKGKTKAALANGDKTRAEPGLTKLQARIRGRAARRQVAAAKAEVVASGGAKSLDATGGRVRVVGTPHKQRQARAKADKDRRSRRSSTYAERLAQAKQARAIQRSYRGHRTRRRVKKLKREVEASGGELAIDGMALRTVPRKKRSAPRARRRRSQAGKQAEAEAEAEPKGDSETTPETRDKVVGEAADVEAKEQEAAAVRLQSQYRGHSVRKEAARQAEAATALQSVYRGHTARKEVEAQVQAATAVQSAYRGHTARADLRRQQAAATRVQSTYRGHKVRVRRPPPVATGVVGSISSSDDEDDGPGGPGGPGAAPDRERVPRPPRALPGAGGTAFVSGVRTRGDTSVMGRVQPPSPESTGPTSEPPRLSPSPIVPLLPDSPKPAPPASKLTAAPGAGAGAAPARPGRRLVATLHGKPEVESPKGAGGAGEGKADGAAPRRPRPPPGPGPGRIRVKRHKEGCRHYRRELASPALNGELWEVLDSTLRRKERRRQHHRHPHTHDHKKQRREREKQRKLEQQRVEREIAEEEHRERVEMAEYRAQLQEQITKSKEAQIKLLQERLDMQQHEAEEKLRQLHDAMAMGDSASVASGTSSVGVRRTGRTRGRGRGRGRGRRAGRGRGRRRKGGSKLASVVSFVAKKRGKPLSKRTVARRGNMTQKDRLLLVRYLAGKPMAAASRLKAEQLITGLRTLAEEAQAKEEAARKYTAVVVQEADETTIKARSRWAALRTVLSGEKSKDDDDDDDYDDVHEYDGDTGSSRGASQNSVTMPPIREERRPRVGSTGSKSSSTRPAAAVPAAGLPRVR